MTFSSHSIKTVNISDSPACNIHIPFKKTKYLSFMFQNEIKHTILPESPLVHVQSLLQPTNTSQVGIDLMDKSRIVSLTHIDWGVTVLKQEIAAHVI